MKRSRRVRLSWSGARTSGLLQLSHSYDATEMYGENYGYRSGLNQSMVRHLSGRRTIWSASIHRGRRRCSISAATTLLAEVLQDVRIASASASTRPPPNSANIISDDIALVPDFFSAAAYRRTGAKPAKIVTSIAMFYDLDDPVQFAREIDEVLADDGVWHFEQSYMPSMLRTGLLRHDLPRASGILLASRGRRHPRSRRLPLIDVQMNAVNGGSFAVTAAKRGCGLPVKPGRDRLDPRAGGTARAWNAQALPRFRRAGVQAP